MNRSDYLTRGREMGAVCLAGITELDASRLANARLHEKFNASFSTGCQMKKTQCGLHVRQNKVVALDM